MKHDSAEVEQDLTIALVLSLSRLSETPTRPVVEDKAIQLAGPFGYEGDLKPIVDNAMKQVDTRMGAGVSLIDVEAEHDEDWARKRNDITWTHSHAYETLLKQTGWSPSVVQSLSDVSARILGHLQDPHSEGAWDRRGLVIGHVQSGKTANYIGLIARAADAGYKFIIVIAGVHNNLRRQTQERIDEGFVGRSSDPRNRVHVGVGIQPDYPHPATLTNIFADFNKQTAERSGWQLNDFSKPIILVIKKNVHTLNALHGWLKEMNAQGDGRISDVPMLMIDDEADHASVNTNKPDIDPTKTNAMIRRILQLFAKSSYIGYTATPFANIFINPEAYDDEVREELFPSDFIYCLDAPNTYFGPEQVFLDDDYSAEVLQQIEDCEDYLPFTHRKDHDLQELPPSLYEAVNSFIIARAIRELRGQGHQHCSMMINVSRFVNVQNLVRNLLSLYEKKLKSAVKACYAMPEEMSRKNAYMRDLKKAFMEDYADRCGFEWTTVKRALNKACDSLRLFVVNSKSDEVLDYRKYERDGEGLTAIAVGGLSLSRGLTIEGLCVSYMYRNTRMYDTLMQMGRWFGYRPGYEDLCRVHLSPDSIDWYAHIAEASEELRQQIRRMRRDGLSPRQFGLYVKAHPDRLLITAANKMRSGEKLTVRQNLSGRLRESYILPKDDQINSSNEELIGAFWRMGFGGIVQPNKKGWEILDAPIGIIENFLNRFRTHPDFAEQKAAVVAYLQKIAEKHPTGDVLLISIKGRGEDEARFLLGLQERTSALPKGDAWRVSKDRVASRGDEKLGLTKAQQDQAQAAARAKELDRPSDYDYREVRRKPLLMIHVLGPVGSKDPSHRVPAFGVSFPPGDYETEVEVVANTVWIERMHSRAVDSPDDEEDYDD